MYSVYILSNPSRTSLYVGVTNDLIQRITEHYMNRGNDITFSGRYYCYELLFWEDYANVSFAIEREKQIKKWSRKKKVELTKEENPLLESLNSNIMEWPPGNLYHR